MREIVLLAALLLGPPALAQEEPEASVGERPGEAEVAEEVQESEETQADEDDPESSPYEYRASEQISEDLSVSFPVDI